MLLAALFENFAAGMGTAAFVAFLMSVCEPRFAASQYALLSALVALSRAIAVRWLVRWHSDWATRPFSWSPSASPSPALHCSRSSARGGASGRGQRDFELTQRAAAACMSR